ncbi:ABC transporter ATP-binding protein [Thermodesulforhabdus norvegica]|uniref:Lipopolysaccharide transport system ATP-binding protein n=1 Tax=Thermodesulforhabdus norvegica TaxID=39841 RepID=A0A1I4UZT6_9BACT|nr:ABC transporter ATP-binding protein [Thermodesulforhabdus norvegica]SFM94484.1 lipopolysaccharide transport system ATP-binding protein [Thermodesulforhabdus norvegica]
MKYSENDAVIEVRDLSKQFRLYRKPSDQLWELITRRTRHQVKAALRNVSFTVRKGESLGIIGENGAGKSTLLQILAGTLPPSSGHVKIHGRVLAILELGTGFYPDFTGRENVVNYARLLGFDESSLRRKIEEIREFSELGSAFDLPVKTYSTGMVMRLAFSVVSSFDPEIMIIDEALSVGDAYFQKKCIDRIAGFQRSGGTLLLCSHAMYHISLMCQRVLWLKDGRIYMEGSPNEVIPQYEWYMFERERNRTLQMEKMGTDPENGSPVCIHECFANADARTPVRTGDTLEVTIKTKAINPQIPYHVAVSVKSFTGWGIFMAGTHLDGIPPLTGDRTVKVQFPDLPLLGGNYYVHVRIFDDRGLVVFDERIVDNIIVAKESSHVGICRLEHKWTVD